MRSCLRLYLCGVLLLLSLISKAQVRCEVIHYTAENGLSHERGTSIIKDTEGFMWAGSWDGINRFDGNSFTSYKSFPGGNTGLKNDRIDQIGEDKVGFLWLKGVDEFYRFDKKNEKFQALSSIIKEIEQQNIYIRRVTSFSKGSIWVVTKKRGLFFIPQTRSSRYLWFHKGDKNYHLPSNSVNFLHQDKQQNIWVGTEEGLACFTRTKPGHYLNKRLPINGAFSFTDFTEDDENLYFSTRQGYVVVYNKKTGEAISSKVSDKKLQAIRKSRKSPLIFCSTLSGELVVVTYPELKPQSSQVCPNVPILSIYEDRSGHLWLEPKTKGIIRFNPHNGAFKWFSQSNNGNNNISNFYSVFEDRDGTVWMSMKGGGFGYYNPSTNSIARFYQAGDVQQYKFPDIVYSVYYDEAGVIWLCTDEGIDKIILHNNQFSQHLLVENSSVVMDNQVRAVYCDSKNRLWLGSKNGHLSVLDKGRKINKPFINEPAGGFGAFYCFLQSRSGVMWIGTKYNGLFKAEPLNKEHSSYKLTHYLKSDGGLSDNDVFALMEDKAGRIWIGTFGGGLNVAVSNKDKTQFFNSKNAFPNYPKESFKRIRHLTDDAHGNLWVASTDGLLLMENAAGKNVLNPRFVHYCKVPEDETSLGDNDLQYIYRDNKNRMWISTSGGGVALALGPKPFEKVAFKNYTKKDGLPNDYSVSSIQDNRGNLWIATQNGLARFNIEEKKFKNYGKADGLLKIAFLESSCTKLKDGTLIFGTTKGYLSFNPKEINTRKLSSNIAFTNLQVNNADIIPGDKDSLLKHNINYVKEVHLAYNQNTIGIDFSILDHKNGTSEGVAYRLKGLSNVWQNDRLQRHAIYTNLPPGEYLFEVRSISAALYANNVSKALHITILPPPWRTWWAYTLYFTLFAGLVAIALRIARTMLRLRQNIAIQQKMADLKVNFFTNVSHELRTPLTLILNPIEEIASKENLSARGGECIQVVKKNAERMVRFMNEWLDLRKIQNGKHDMKVAQVDVVALVKKVGEYFTEVSNEKNIQLQIEANAAELFAWIDAEKIDVVVYNLLANAFKYSHENTSICVNINQFKESGHFVIEVCDQGIGVPADRLNDIFELYYVEDCPETKSNKGIGIGLALCKELVGLHHGKISARNNKTGGLVVAVELKLGKEHFNKTEVQIIEIVEPEDIFLPLANFDFPQLNKAPIASQRADIPLVLLVEDNAELRNFLQIQLSELYRVELAQNGEIGLKKAKELLPDLILSDVMMPVMDGIAMLDRLKNDTATSHIPVVLLSAKASLESQIEGIRYGADFYITKPFRNDHLLAAIKNLITQRKNIFNSIIEQKTIVDLGPGEIIITSKDEEFLKRVIATVENGMSNPEFNIDMVAEAIGMGRTTFYNKFKSLTNLTPVEFVRDMRLKRAKQYLDAGETNISTVAYDVGFNNAKYFSTCFKEKYKIAPKEYVKSVAAGVQAHQVIA